MNTRSSRVALWHWHWPILARRALLHARARLLYSHSPLFRAKVLDAALERFSTFSLSTTLPEGIPPRTRRRYVFPVWISSRAVRRTEAEIERRRFHVDTLFLRRPALIDMLMYRCIWKATLKRVQGLFLSSITWKIPLSTEFFSFKMSPQFYD